MNTKPESPANQDSNSSDSPPELAILFSAMSLLLTLTLLYSSLFASTAEPFDSIKKGDLEINVLEKMGPPKSEKPTSNGGRRLYWSGADKGKWLKRKVPEHLNSNTHYYIYLNKSNRVRSTYKKIGRGPLGSHPLDHEPVVTPFSGQKPMRQGR